MCSKWFHTQITHLLFLMLFASSLPDDTSAKVPTSKREQSSNSKAIDLIIFRKVMTTTDQISWSFIFILSETGNDLIRNDITITLFYNEAIWLCTINIYFSCKEFKHFKSYEWLYLVGYVAGFIIAINTKPAFGLLISNCFLTVAINKMSSL